MGDAGALNQVFLNILKNAAEAIEGEGGAIQVTVSEEEGQVLVRVRDPGPGMEAAVKERLFEPFFTTKAAGEGTGLGLSMSRRIVERHGGSIEIASEPGEGTCVTVRLPSEGANGA
jgi:signal transduction histidine kinase